MTIDCSRPESHGCSPIADGKGAGRVRAGHSNEAWRGGMSKDASDDTRGVMARVTLIDLRQAARSLARAPGFTTVAVNGIEVRGDCHRPVAGAVSLQWPQMEKQAL